MHSYLGAGVTTDRCQFTLFYLFYFSLFFCILFACLRFGSHFRSHDSHVTGEHMVELGGHFLLFFFCKSKQFFNVHVHVHVHCIFKVYNIFGASTGSSIQGIECFNQGSICGTHNATSTDLRIYSCLCFP